MILIFTHHAKQQMITRGISEKQVKNCLQKGSKIKQTKGLLASYTYIQVAYKVIGEKYIIKTVMVR